MDQSSGFTFMRRDAQTDRRTVFIIYYIITLVQLKGFDESKTLEENDRILDVLDLNDKRDAQARTLSGGMKRKLSLAIAFSAGSKVRPLHTMHCIENFL